MALQASSACSYVGLYLIRLDALRGREILVQSGVGTFRGNRLLRKPRRSGRIILNRTYYTHVWQIFGWLLIIPHDVWLRCWGSWGHDVGSTLWRNRKVSSCQRMLIKHTGPRTVEFNSWHCCWCGMSAVSSMTFWTMIHFSSTKIFWNLVPTSRCFVVAAWLQCVGIRWVSALLHSTLRNRSPYSGVRQRQITIGTSEKKNLRIQDLFVMKRFDNCSNTYSTLYGSDDDIWFSAVSVSLWTLSIVLI
jgi:hypothetical protein